MRIVISVILLLTVLVIPVSAADLTAPTVPPSGEELMPEDTTSFGNALMEMLSKAVSVIHPDLQEASQLCQHLMATVFLASLVKTLTDKAQKVTDLVGITCLGLLLLRHTDALIHLGVDTVSEISQYGKLLLPVMTAAMVAQGGITSSAALYTGTALFNSLLSGLIAGVLTPMIYVYLAMATANRAIGDNTLKQFCGFIKWLVTWCLKIILYIFTGYMGITGVVSGTTDAATLKAAKITISGVVPVVGGILSDASEAVLVSAGVVKNAAGIYGVLAVLALCLGPFLKIGIHYLMLKASSALCGVFGSKQICGFLEDFSTAMGLLLAMTGSVCLLLLISIVCFLRGVTL